MNFFSIVSVAIVLIVSSTSFARSSTFVGNGGEGIFVGEKLVLRDFYDFGVQNNPWIGQWIDPSIERELGDWNPLELSEQTRTLLLRKLTDANIFSPRLGTILIMSLRFYRWHWVSEELPLLSECDARFSIPDEKRVTIANRYLDSIAVNRGSFEKLDPTSQVGLLIHEAAFSLTRLSSLPSGEACPRVQNPRFVTAKLFSADEGTRGLLTSIVTLLLSVPTPNERIGNVDYCSDAQIKVRLTDPSTGVDITFQTQFEFGRPDNMAKFLKYSYAQAKDLQTQALEKNSIQGNPADLTFEMTLPKILVVSPLMYAVQSHEQIMLAASEMYGTTWKGVGLDALLKQHEASTPGYRIHICP